VQIIWSKTAIANLIEIRAYIGMDNPHAASRMAQNLLQAGNALKTLPNRGRPTGLTDVRELVVPGTPYLLVYRVTAEAVQILRVWHGAQERS